MSVAVVRTTLVTLVVVAAFAGGFHVGQRRSLDVALTMMAADTTGNLAQRVETLARIKTGDHAGAIALLEHGLDAATTTLPMGKPWSGLDRSTQSALQLAKAYRSVFPPAASETALVELLETIPPPEVQYCSPALRQVIENGARR